MSETTDANDVWKLVKALRETKARWLLNHKLDAINYADDGDLSKNELGQIHILWTAFYEEFPYDTAPTDSFSLRLDIALKPYSDWRDPSS